MNMLNKMNRGQPPKAEYFNGSRVLGRVVSSVINRAAHSEAQLFESQCRERLVAEFEEHLAQGGAICEWVNRHSVVKSY